MILVIILKQSRAFLNWVVVRSTGIILQKRNSNQITWLKLLTSLFDIILTHQDELVAPKQIFTSTLHNIS